MKILGITPTKEQVNILQQVKDYKNIIVQSYAGTGKSRTCLMATKDNTKLKFLYLSFSRKLIDEMTELVNEYGITNMEVRSLHGLAMRYTMHRYGYSLRKYIHINDIKSIFPTYNYIQLKSMVDKLEKFCNSDLDLDKLDKRTTLLWNHIISSKRLTYSVFAKQFILLLQQKKLHLNKYDYIILDEIQDLSPCFVQLIKATSNKHLILGDKHQAIYNFLLNGYNTFDNLPKDYNVLTLSKSFRCSPIIAEQANMYLREFLYAEVEFKGTPYVKPTKNYTIAMLSRTNSQIIQSITKILKKNKRFSLKSDIDEIFKIPLQIEILLKEKTTEYKDCKNLKELQRVYKNFDTQLLKDILSFKYNRHNRMSINDYLMYESLNIEIQSSVKLLNSLPNGTTFANIKSRAKSLYSSTSRLQLLTIHASKGLGFDTVIFEFNTNIHDIMLKGLETFCIKNKYRIQSNDYSDMYIEDIYKLLYNDNDVREELNLLYVAYTRAKDKVYYGKQEFKFDTIDTVLDKMTQYLKSTFASHHFPNIT